MTIDILTLFPSMFDAPLGESIIGRAQLAGHVTIRCHQIRDFTENRQNQVDDYPYGGGQGCVMQAQPLYAAWQHARDLGGPARTIFLSPRGRVFTQAEALRLAEDYERLILVCGHYEGVDQRFIDLAVDEELSIGDFVLTGGEIPAMALADAVCRLVPGALRRELFYRGEPLGRAVGVPPILPPGGLGGTGGTGGVAVGRPQSDCQLAAQAGFSHHTPASAGHV